MNQMVKFGNNCAKGLGLSKNRKSQINKTKRHKKIKKSKGKKTTVQHVSFPQNNFKMFQRKNKSIQEPYCIKSNMKRSEGLSCDGTDFDKQEKQNQSPISYHMEQFTHREEFIIKKTSDFKKLFPDYYQEKKHNRKKPAKVRKFEPIRVQNNLNSQEKKDTKND